MDRVSSFDAEMTSEVLFVDVYFMSLFIWIYINIDWWSILTFGFFSRRAKDWHVFTNVLV